MELEEKTTHVFAVLDEDNLELLKNKNNEVALFKSALDANEFASNNIGLWQVLELHFNHKFVQHKTNMKW